ncbi:uncharacterized protein BT62DRAFT_737965 [Guyanagaster necrorhizus]|uniref:Zinc-finger domain-containing protein n=1 Tax=Guyanagaster necrorhizus TaxID=856835 RepID=A0A9P7VF31_9AGAR|nr:uncharacterized protein BT62DRAFT_737965 [Guyanagaster necrorhizus MCA 3950]KAG7439412.1 hypothetical protein BT62DRAFT_737965 [Guyanagaster necrorhizus MCA 3950]
MIKRKRAQSPTYSSQDEISVVVQPSPSRQAEVGSSPRKRGELSTEGMSSPPPRKKSKRDEVLTGVDEYNRCPDVSGRASVIRDPLPKKLKVKPKPSKRMESVRPRTHSFGARMKSVNCRAKTIQEFLSPDQEPVMTFSVYYDDTLEHVRLIDAREGIYEYSMQDDDPDTVTEEALSMNLQFIRRRLNGHGVVEDIEWHDPEAGSRLGVDVGTSPPTPPMSPKAGGKQSAVPTVPENHILLSPAYDIDTNLDNNYVYLEDNHSVFHDPHTGLSEPQVGPTTHFPLVHHSPIHNSATSFPSSTSFQGKEQLLDPLHDSSSLQGNSRLQDDLPHLWLEDSEPLHNGTIDPSLLGGGPNPPSPAVQIEAENMLDEWEMSDLTSLEDSSSPCIDLIPLEPHPSPKLKKRFRPPDRRKRSEWPVTDKESFCHQCRNRSFRASVYCGCGKAYCVRCIKIKYDNLEFDADAKDFVCPKCNNTCTCDICTRARGEVYHSMRVGSTKRALPTRSRTVEADRPSVSSSRSTRKLLKSRRARDAEGMYTEERSADHSALSSRVLAPTQHRHQRHVQRCDPPHVSLLGGWTTIPPLSERKQGPVKYWGSIYGFSGEKIGTAYIPEDGNSNTLLVQRSRVFVGEIQPVWGLGTNPLLREVDPARKEVNKDAQTTRRRFVGQQAPLFMPIRTIDSSGVIEYGSDADGEDDPEGPGNRLTSNDEHPGFEWRRGEALDPDKISLADEDVTSVVIMSLKQIGVTAVVSTE